MGEYRFHLQKYKPGTKTTCPSCGKGRCFVRYIDELAALSFQTMSVSVIMRTVVATTIHPRNISKIILINWK